ncbi:MAG TPA: SigB/SigF/SigG family RNA polymerase sigma factor [Armatimonadota bacterium]|nr:SigB/SigF/SigG family RNA polymerase sigma factor [Armatimonadota bacterium]
MIAAPAAAARSKETASCRSHTLSGEELAARYARSRCPQVREHAILEYRNLVEILAAKMSRKGVSTDDLIQVGTIGLILALDRFDPERGVKFTTYAVNTIVGEIKHYFRDCTWLVKVPRQLQECAATVHRTNEQMVRELGRSPTLSELAARLSLTEEQIVEAMELEVVYAPYSLDAHLGTEDAETHERLNDVLGQKDARLERVVEHAPLWRGIEELEPRKRWILRRRYFDDWSQSEVGRALGISQMHVSRLEREALRELQRVMTG